jgi:hypothetical protein
VGSWKVESPDELQEELIKGGKGNPLGGVARQAKGKGFGIACQSVVRVHEEDSKSSPTTTPKNT